jgi:hypothetical protein
MKKVTDLKKRASGKLKSKNVVANAGPVVPTRGIAPAVSLHLYVRAGGRCEFDGCTAYLMEHPTTNAIGNFAQQAHIFAFKEHGPRGDSLGRPENINNIANLMLLCHPCHHLIDKVEPEKYPVDVLRKFKQSHEDRIYQLTGIPNDRDTIPLVVKAQIAGRALEISDAELQLASAPNYMRVRDKVLVDLTDLPDVPESGYFQAAMRAIDAKIDMLNRTPLGKGGSRRVSVFALAPIPLLIYLGSKLSDKWTVDLYQRRRVDENPWTWEPGEGNARFMHRQLAQGDQGVALMVNLSGRNDASAFGAAADGWSIHEITIEGDIPNPMAMRTRADLERFKSVYVHALATIRDAHPLLTQVHVLAAVPAPAAICMGMMRLPKVDSQLLIYDRDNRSATIEVCLTI